MTNTTYFHSVVRDYESASTSSESDGVFEEEDSHVESSQYGCWGCTKPQIQLFKQAYNSTTSILAGFQSPNVDCAPSTPDVNQYRRKLFYATPQGVSSNLKIFDFNELRKATRNFHVDDVLGSGGFGSVYKGWIDESMLIATTAGRGIAVAVKRLNLQGSQGYREWLTEAQYLGKLYHPNLIKLLGYSFEDAERLLVYEFMPRGSLENHLFRRGSPCQLSWRIRMNIALGAAKALAFLHSAENTIIHCDFTSSNILLDSTYNAKLSDFGFSMACRTIDYINEVENIPGCPRAQCDVFSFGVIFLELLSGRRALDKNCTPGEQVLAKWAIPYLNNKREVFHVPDPHLEGQYSLERAQKAAKLALQCVSMEPLERPSMEKVVTTLEQLQGFKG